MSYEAALDFIIELNDAEFGGYNNWKLPTVIEALSLINKSEKSNGEFPLNTFSDVIDVFWTSDQSIIKDRLWVMLTDQRTVREYNRKDFAYVWPVSDIAQQSDIEMVSIPGGEFMMGSDSATAQSFKQPVHRVRVSSFEIGKYPVTQGQWEKVMGELPSFFQEGDDYPVKLVRWNDCQKFIEKLNDMSGDNYRLLTEAEWEYACRAGTTGDRYGDLDDIAWYSANSGGSVHPVGRKMPNDFGLYDMLGNVDEWCSDKFYEYKSGYETDPSGLSSGYNRVYRGGSWFSGGGCCSATWRFNWDQNYRCDHLGFRLARG